MDNSYCGQCGFVLCRCDYSQLKKPYKNPTKKQPARRPRGK